MLRTRGLRRERMGRIQERVDGTGKASDASQGKRERLQRTALDVTGA